MQRLTSSLFRPDTGLVAGLGGIAKNLFGLLVSRIELAALECAEIGGSLLKLFSVFAIAMLAAWFAIAFWSALIVALTWQSLGWMILLIMAAGFTLLVIGLLIYARSVLRQNKWSLSATMAELKRDRDALL